MKPGVIAIIIVVVLGVTGIGLYFATAEKESTSSNPSTISSNSSLELSANDSSTQSDLAGPPTREQVALHASKDDCWTIIDNVVYDLTSYIPRHQGGDNILSACGVDGTAFFKGEKAGQAGDTNNHGGAAKSDLAKLKVGELAN